MAIEPIGATESPSTWPGKIRNAVEYWNGPATLTSFAGARAALNTVATELGTPTLSDKAPASEQRPKINAIFQAINSTGPLNNTAAILGAGGLDYALYDSSALDRMWQESTGQTQVSAIGNSAGLIVGREKQGRKTFAQVMAGQADLRSLGSVLNTGTPPVAGTYNSSTGAGKISRGIGSGSQVRLSFSLGATPDLVAIDVENLASSNGTLSVRDATGSSSIFGVAPGTRTRRLVPAGSSFSLRCNSDNQELDFILHEVKSIPAHFATQATNNSRPVLQSDGLKFDGSDDNLLTDWFAQSGANCIIAQVTVPAALASTQMIAGTVATSANFWLGLSGTTGKTRMGFGDQLVTFSASANVLGQQTIVALSFDGSTVRAYENDQQIGTAIPTTPPETSVSARIGAGNGSGTAQSWFGGSIKRIAFGKTALTLQQFQQIRAEWLAAA
jgi:hypothetical protein